MHRLGEILAHDGIAVLAVIFALGAAVLSLANALSQEAVSAIEQHAREDDLHFNILHTRFDYAYVLQALLAAMIVVAALLGGWRLTRGQLKTCPECLSEIPHDASICRYRTSELLEIPR